MHYHIGHVISAKWYPSSKNNLKKCCHRHKLCEKKAVLAFQGCLTREGGLLFLLMFFQTLKTSLPICPELHMLHLTTDIATDKYATANLVTLLYWWPKKKPSSLKTESLNSCQIVACGELRLKILCQKGGETTKTPNNWKPSVKVRTRLQNILKVAETESRDNERETNHTRRWTLLLRWLHRWDQRTLGRTCSSEALFTPCASKISRGIWSTYLWWLGGALNRLNLYLQLLKMIRLVKYKDERGASEGSAKAN